MNPVNISDDERQPIQPVEDATDEEERRIPYSPSGIIYAEKLAIAGRKVKVANDRVEKRQTATKLKNKAHFRLQSRKKKFASRGDRSDKNGGLYRLEKNKKRLLTRRTTIPAAHDHGTTANATIPDSEEAEGSSPSYGMVSSSQKRLIAWRRKLDAHSGRYRNADELLGVRAVVKTYCNPHSLRGVARKGPRPGNSILTEKLAIAGRRGNKAAIACRRSNSFAEEVKDEERGTEEEELWWLEKHQERTHNESMAYCENEPGTAHNDETASQKSQNELSTPLGAIAVFPGGMGVQRLFRDANSRVGSAEGFLLDREDEPDIRQRHDADYSAADDEELGIFMAELAGTGEDDNVLVIEGVKTNDPSISRRICLLVGVLVVASVLAVVTGTITTRILASYRGGKSTVSSNQTTSFPPQIPKSVSVNINHTIGDYLNEGKDSVDIFLAAGSREIFQSMLNRTDTTFTLFSAADGAPLGFGSDFSVISKLVLPLWVGHLLDVIRGYVVEGRGLAPEDLYDGVVLTSVSGYPLYIQMDPFRVNNNTMEAVGVDNEFNNGFIYFSFTYPNPFAPWIGKSLFDVLVETNSVLNGDLSRFIALVEASPQVKEKIELRKGSTKATTMFVPMNNALATLLDADQMSRLETNATLQQLLLTNHLVDGNFATLCWWITIPGYTASSTELQLETQAGQVLDFYVSKTTGVITINGDATIIHQEAFGEQGIVHVIDKPLVGNLFL